MSAVSAGPPSLSAPGAPAGPIPTAGRAGAAHGGSCIYRRAGTRSFLQKRSWWW